MPLPAGAGTKPAASQRLSRNTTPAYSNGSDPRFRIVAWQKLELALYAVHPRLDRVTYAFCVRRRQILRVEAGLCPNHCPSAEAQHGNESAVFPVHKRPRCSGT